MWPFRKKVSIREAKIEVDIGVYTLRYPNTSRLSLHNTLIEYGIFEYKVLSDKHSHYV